MPCIFRLLLGTRRPAFAEGVIRADALIGGVDYREPRDCLLVRLHDLRWGTRNSTAKPGPPESLARGRFEPIRLIHVGWEARKAPVDAVVFFLDFPSYRTYQELAFRVCDHHGFAE